MLAGPASRAACTTFDRPNAKSNCADVNAAMTGISAAIFVGLAPAPRRPRSCAPRPRQPSEALRIAATGSPGQRGFGPAEADRDPPGLVGDASASSAARSSSRSTVAPRSAAARTSRLKLRAKTLRLTASSTAARRRRDPDAAAGQPALEVRDHRAVRRDDEPDQLVDRLDLARERAQPLRAARCLRAARGRCRACRRAPASVRIVSVAHCAGGAASSAGASSAARRREIGFGDPAGLEARLHDHRLALLARQLEAVEEAGLVLRSRRPCARSSRRDRRWRSRPDPPPS